MLPATAAEANSPHREAAGASSAGSCRRATSSASSASSSVNGLEASPLSASVKRRWSNPVHLPFGAPCHPAAVEAQQRDNETEADGGRYREIQHDANRQHDAIRERKPVAEPRQNGCQKTAESAIMAAPRVAASSRIRSSSLRKYAFSWSRAVMLSPFFPEIPAAENGFRQRSANNQYD